jgi:cytochrome c556
VKAAFSAPVRALLMGGMIITAVLALANRVQSEEAQKSAGERAVEYRQALLTVLGSNFAALIDVAQGKATYNASDVAKRADRVASVAQWLEEAFPPDSNGVGGTKAKPEIWKQQADFQKDLQSLIDHSVTLAAAAKSGDQAKLKPAALDTARACKACHDDFRAQ